MVQGLRQVRANRFDGGRDKGGDCGTGRQAVTQRLTSHDTGTARLDSSTSRHSRRSTSSSSRALAAPPLLHRPATAGPTSHGLAGLGFGRRS